MIETRELEALAGLGAALWADEPTYRQRVVEALAAVCLRDFADSQVIDRTAVALLEIANQAGMASNTQTNMAAISLPFYRLFPDERFLLVALHRAKWSYARTARLLGLEPEKIEELAWRARVHLAALARGTVSANLIPYPAGADGHKPSCPEWDAKRPWAQRFLDDEIRGGSQRFFLQNHLMACDGCRGTLVRCKDLYYALEDLMPELDQAEPKHRRARESGPRFIQALEQVCTHRPRPEDKKTGEPIDYGQITFRQSLQIYFARPEVRVMLGGIGLVVLYQLLSLLRHH